MKLTYFVQQGPKGVVKIGSSYRVKAALREIRSGKLLAVTSDPPEPIRHKFRRAHAFKTWFLPTADLLQFTERLSERSPILLRKQEKEGLSKFGEFLRDQKISYAEAARALGITRAYAQMIGSGVHAPSTKLGLKIMTWVKTLDPAGDFKHEDLFDD